MADKKKYSPSFLEYMENIVSSEAYEGIPFERKKNGEIRWLAPKKNALGKKRISWAKEKAIELGIDYTKEGWLSKTMFAIHPTKYKPCQICGKSMCLYYIYPNYSFIKSLKKEYGELVEFVNHTTAINDIVDILLKNDISENSIRNFLLKKFKLTNFQYAKPLEMCSTNELLSKCEVVCRHGFSKLLGPGAMSNFPDRLDGFHSYNRCCRKKEDKGRSAENMKTYSKDRRAYELWSDGNIYAANKYMKSHVFSGQSADHIGPISLGFKHESIFMQPMLQGPNSSKRDRLPVEDLKKLIYLEKSYNTSAVSWYSQTLWQYIKNNYANLTEEDIRVVLKENVNNYMEILWFIKNNKNGIEFLYNYFIEPKVEHFNYNYKFDQNGKIISKTERSKTDTYHTEIKRLFRVSMDSLEEYHAKENRNLKIQLSEKQENLLQSIFSSLLNKQYDSAFAYLKNLFEDLQQVLINNLKWR